MVTQRQIDEIVRILVEECQPEKIILFGSYAQGTAREDSDLDLAIVKETDLPGFKRPIEFQKALRAKGQRWLFGMDILVFTPEEMETYKDSRASIIHEILLTGQTLYESKRSARLAHQG
jgi:predicted nucleotidyltransferase